MPETKQGIPPQTEPTAEILAGDAPPVDIEQEEERESTRRNLVGPTAIVFGLLAAGMSLYHLFTSSFWMPPQFQHRAVHLALALALDLPVLSGRGNKGPPQSAYVNLVFS